MVSIIYTHWAQNEFRSKLMHRSIDSLIRTAGTEEILVADNGGNIEDSTLLMELCEAKNIALYLKFRENMHFAFARNALLDLATQPYICICDNDIVFEDGWWQECVEYLKRNPGAVVTPLVPDISHRTQKSWRGELDGWQINAYAGSPCFMMARETYQKLGKFPRHNTAGSKYAREIARLCGGVSVMPQCKAVDIGERNGYDWRNPLFSEIAQRTL